MNVQITKVVPKRALVTVTAKANQATQFTAWLLKGSTESRDEDHDREPTIATLKLKPLKALKAGYYVQVRAWTSPGLQDGRKKIVVS